MINENKTDQLFKRQFAQLIIKDKINFSPNRKQLIINTKFDTKI